MSGLGSDLAKGGQGKSNVAHDTGYRHSASDSAHQAEGIQAVAHGRIMDSTDHLVLRVKSDGTVVFANLMARQFYGLASSGPESGNWLAATHPDDVENARALLSQVASTFVGSCRIENRQIIPHGGIRDFVWVASRHEEDETPESEIDLIGRDVTDPRRIEELYRAFVDNSLQGLVILQHHRIVFANRAYEKMTQYTTSELMAMDQRALLETVHPDDRDKVRRHALGQAGGEAAPDCYEYRGLRKDGTTYWTSMYASRITYLGKPAVQAALVDVTERYRVQEDLLRYRKSYRELVENATEGIFIAQDGAVKFGNRKVSDLTGFSPDELAHMPFADLIHPDDRQMVLDRYLSRLRGETPPTMYDFRVIHKDRQPRWVQISSALVQWEGRPATLNFVSDVTARKQAEQALRDSEERYRSIFEHSPIGIMQLDSRGVIVDCNEALARILGSAREKVVAFNMLTQLTDEDMLTAVRHALAGETGNYEGYYRSVTGRNNVPVRAEYNAIIGDDGTVVGAVGMVEDVTERLRSQEEADRSKQMYRTLAEHSTDIISRIDRDHRIQYINRAVHTITGIEPSFFIGRSIDSIGARQETTRAISTEIDRVFRTGQMAQFEIDYTTTRGTAVFDVRLVLETGTGGAPTVLATARDITENRRLQEFASRAQRLEAAGRIAGQVAHDFNNLLGPLVAYPALIRDELATDHPVLEYVDDMEKAAEQISDINQQLLTLGRRGHYNLEPLDLNEIVVQTCRQMPPPAPGVALVANLADRLMAVRGGGSQVLRVVSNLLANAYDSVGTSGTVTVRTENLYVDSPIGTLWSIPVGEYVRLTVSDTGSGISADILPRIFDPFFTTKTSDRKRGSGLGLSVVHTVVDDHGGFVDCETAPGRGTSMFVYLPITRDVPESPGNDLIVGGNERILVVDDDQMQREVSVRLLEKLGYHASAAASGEQALSLLTAESYDLVLLDMIMPGGMDGAETLEKALALVPDQRAVIVSGFAESDRVKMALALGATEYVRKPLSLRSVARAVRRSLDQARPAPIDT